jgi:nitroreductase
MLRSMELDEAIHTRRTVKEFQPEPIPRDTLEQLFELARWAPNHRMTEPWRFRVLGPEALRCLKECAGEGAAKLDRAPTLVLASYVPSPLPLHAAEDAHAAACAVYAVLLGATARGIATYWRTPGILRQADGRAACGLADDEVVVGLLHFGYPVGQPLPPPERKPTASFVDWLD